MQAPRTLLAGVFVSVVSVALACAAAAPADAVLGPRIKIHPHVLAHGYSKPTHHIRGRVGIVNMTNHKVSVHCKVVVELMGGGAHKKGHGGANADVPAHGKRKPHFKIQIHDADHHLKNAPKHIATHCHRT